jgi:hypothetical protein
MKMIQTGISYFLLISIFTNASCAQPQSSNKPAKKIAVTIDDLPLNIASRVSTEEMKSIVEKLIARIRTEALPVTAFVNENKLEIAGIRDSQRVNILKTWVDSGIELGNHTYSHKSANDVPVDEFEQDILKGERTIKDLTADRGIKVRYFRHPYLMTGRSLEGHNEITKFLHDHDYTIAPVTIDNSEWIFSAAFDKAKRMNDTVLMKKIGQEYIGYMKSKFQYYERQSDKLFGRQMNQILLIHSNRLNSEYFNILCTMIKGQGYRFITLDEALKDPAYASRDTYTGKRGISWLDRWAITQGKTKDFFTDEPKVPPSVMQLADVDSE